MPYVVVDTSVSLPATLSPRGLTRKFWVLLALGALTYEVGHRRLELDELAREAKAVGGRVGGLDTMEGLVKEAEERRAALAELLPYGTPDDWVAVGSAALFDEYERKVRESASRFDPALREEDATRLRRQLEAVCVAGTPPFDSSNVPVLTADPTDDPIVYTALLVDADLLISDDGHIVPGGDEHVWAHAEHQVRALKFGRLVSECFEGFDWSAVDGRWLAEAFAPRA